MTPNHILTQKSSQVPPPGHFTDTEAYSRVRWKQVQTLAEEFWKKWKLEYLSSIIQRQKWNTPEQNLKIGDIVMLVEADKPRNQWKVISVDQVFPGNYGLVRNVAIRLGYARHCR